MLIPTSIEDKTTGTYGLYITGFNNHNEVEDFYEKIIAAKIVTRHFKPLPSPTLTLIPGGKT